MIKTRKPSKRTRMQRKDDHIRIRNFIIKSLVDIIAKEKIQIPSKLFEIIKLVLNLNITKEDVKTEESEEKEFESIENKDEEIIIEKVDEGEKEENS